MYLTPTPTPDRSRRSALRAADGFTMIMTIAVMFIISLLVAAAFVAASGEINASARVTSQKRAYYAAEAGISWYLLHLTENGNFLHYCSEPTGLARSANPLNEFYKTPTGSEEVTASELYKIAVPGANQAGEEEFAIQLIPAASAPAGDKRCDPNKLAETMIERSGIDRGTFRIKATGFSDHGREARSIVATFKNEGFLSFVYYTVYETLDPSTYPSRFSSHSRAEAEITCAHPFEYESEGKRVTRPEWCVPIYFATGDDVKGPLHTQDHVGVIGSPIFGREKGDKIEFATAANDSCGSPDEGYSEEYRTGCGKPEFKGEHIPPPRVEQIQPPSSDNELIPIAEKGGYVFEGAREIILNGASITVRKAGSSEAGETKPFPENGVIYVKSTGTCPQYRPYADTYPGNTACGTAFVRGEYTKSLTIGTADDIVINGNVVTPNIEGVPTGSAVLGLIANNFVRIYHPVAESTGEPTCSRFFRGEHCSCSSGTYNPETKKCEYENTNARCDAPTVFAKEGEEGKGTLKDPTIYAAILALNHSFIVDNFQCQEGAGTMGTLTVHGAIAQRFRGPVGLVGSSGYVKNYEYDNRLEAGEPPYFLNPVEAAWKIERETIGPAPK
jgi:type II secretory pathway pseudopilin PulG